jgi:hypothetical protein
MLFALQVSPTPHVTMPHIVPPPELEVPVVVVPVVTPVPVLLAGLLPPAPGPVVAPPAPGPLDMLPAVPPPAVPVEIVVLPPQPTATSQTKPQAAERNNGNRRTFLWDMNDLLEQDA